MTTIRDRSGNRIEFYYTEDATNGSYRPASIVWTSNPSMGTSAGYTMAFVYASQPVDEIEVGYAAGGVVRDVMRATQIDVSHGTTLVRRYNLAYQAGPISTKRSRLESVTECGGAAGSDCLPATTFSYQNGTPGLASAVAAGFSTPVPASAMSLDVNGDGLSDLVYSSSATSGAGTWMVALSTGAGFSTPINTGIANTNFNRAVPIDYNGDGLEDFLVPYSGGT